ncbi:MAG TPA: hypothetical protein VME41_16110 [Stellaceae bacterium]|nr:hypothetical protein [Stellaceae bacterium]
MHLIPIAAAAMAAGALAAAVVPGAAAQQPFAARANITVENSSPVPQIVAGTSVPPFQLPPYHETMLAMTAPPPPAVPGVGTPVRFYYSVGEAPGPQCRGTIEMDVLVRGTAASSNAATHCVARSLAIGGAACNIAVSARNSLCEGGLAFIAP